VLHVFSKMDLVAEPDGFRSGILQVMSQPLIASSLGDYFSARRPPGVVSAYLFGSHARGTAHAESDVDVALLFDYGQLRSRAARARAGDAMSADLIAVTHVNAVDVVVLNDAPPELAGAVVRDGQRLYQADPEADHAFIRQTFLREADLRPFLLRTRRLKLEAIVR